MSRAYELLEDQLMRGVMKKTIAEAIGYSRPAVSRYLAKSYGAGVEKIEAAIIRRYERHTCPADGQQKSLLHCKNFALRPRPHGFPDAESLWLVCQTCPNKPDPEGTP